MCSYGCLKSQCVEKNHFLIFFLENVPLRESFQNSVPKGFIATPTDVLCSNFMKFDRREIVKSCVAYLTKNKTSLALQLSVLRGSRQNLPGPAPDNALRVLQISSISVHFRRSYIRTREHRQNALQSEYNIRLKPSFEPKM